MDRERERERERERNSHDFNAAIWRKRLKIKWDMLEVLPSVAKKHNFIFYCTRAGGLSNPCLFSISEYADVTIWNKSKNKKRNTYDHQLSIDNYLFNKRRKRQFKGQTNSTKDENVQTDKPMLYYLWRFSSPKTIFTGNSWQFSPTILNDFTGKYHQNWTSEGLLCPV